MESAFGVEHGGVSKSEQSRRTKNAAIGGALGAGTGAAVEGGIRGRRMLRTMALIERPKVRSGKAAALMIGGTGAAGAAAGALKRKKTG